MAWALPCGKADQVEVHGKNRAWVEERVPLRHISFSPISGPYLDPLFFRSLSGYLACPLSKKTPQPHATCTLPQPYPVSSHGFQTEPGTRSSSLTLPKPRNDPSHLLSMYLSSELLRGFSLNAMERNFRTGGSIFFWLCMEERLRQRSA